MATDEQQQPSSRDFEPHSFRAGDEGWVASWHPPAQPPTGVAHGAAGVCLTPAGEVVLISEDGVSWDLPGGRPEGAESGRETLAREVLEEACASVGTSTRLGFSRGECVTRVRQGLVLVRSLWAAEVELRAWEPRFETRHREVLTPAGALGRLDFRRAPGAIYRRAFREAGLLATG